MPCKPAKARHLLDDKKAIVINLCPFTIRLEWDCESNTQAVVVGLDTGAVNVGCSATTENKVLYASETKLRTDIVKKMQRRLSYRRTRRAGLRYRQPRFDNRTRKDGWLPPSLKSKADTTIKIVKEISKILPISKVVVEIAKFDIQKINNPEIEGKGYQEGRMSDYVNVREYVFARDKHVCQICKKDKGILQTHHIKQRKDSGSDNPDNLVTLHKQCHEDYHAGNISHKFTKPREFKVETQITILKDYIVKSLQKHFAVEITYGYVTKENRKRLKINKTHYNDAIAICNPKDINKPTGYFKRVCVARGRYQQTKGIRSEIRLPKGKLFGFSQWDKVKLPDKTIAFIKGKRSSGYFDVCDIDGKSIFHSMSHTKLNLIKNTRGEVTDFIPTINDGVSILTTL